MKTIELDACRKELVRDILATDNMEVLKAVHRAYRRAMNKTMKETEREAPMTACEDVVPYMTQAELKQQIKRSQEDIRQGRTYTADEMEEYFRGFDYEG